MAVVFSKQRFDFACKTTIEQFKKVFQKRLTYVFLAKWEKNTVNKMEENEPEKLNLQSKQSLEHANYCTVATKPQTN